MKSPTSELMWFKDPNTSQFVVDIANRWVVSMLGNVIHASQAETLERNEVKSIWDDRTLNRAYQVFGGRPTIEFEDANDLFPADLKRRLVEMTTFGLDR